MSADVRDLLRRAQAHGLTVNHKRGGHREIRRGEQTVTVSASPHGHAWIKAALADIRRAFDIDLRTAPRPKRRRNRKGNTT